MSFSYFTLSRAIHLPELFADDAVSEHFYDFFPRTGPLQSLGSPQTFHVPLQRLYAGR